MTGKSVVTLSPRKQEILAVAQELFSQQGYAATSIRDLAKVLEIKPASLYSHYDSKEEILWEIALRGAQEFLDAVRPIAAQPLAPNLLIEEMVAAHVQVIIRHKDVSAIFFKEWKRLSEPRRSEYGELIQTYEEIFSQVIQQGMDAGLFSPLPPKFVTSMLLASINWIQHWYQENGPMRPTEVAKHCQRFILSGLSA